MRNYYYNQFISQGRWEDTFSGKKRVPTYFSFLVFHIWFFFSSDKILPNQRWMGKFCFQIRKPKSIEFRENAKKMEGSKRQNIFIENILLFQATRSLTTSTRKRQLLSVEHTIMTSLSRKTQSWRQYRGETKWSQYQGEKRNYDVTLRGTVSNFMLKERKRYWYWKLFSLLFWKWHIYKK